jgi:hypothetical protein
MGADGEHVFWKHFGNIGGGLSGNERECRRTAESQEIALLQALNRLSESLREFARIALGITGRLGVGGSNPLAPTIFLNVFNPFSGRSVANGPPVATSLPILFAGRSLGCRGQGNES